MNIQASCTALSSAPLLLGVSRRRVHLTLVAVGLLALGSCRCSSSVVAAAPAKLAVTPGKLVLGSVYVGQQGVGRVSAVNEGGGAVEVDVSVAAPFAVAPSQLRLAGGSSVDLVVTFTPVQPGPVAGVLSVGTLEVPVEAVGLEVPACFSDSVCVEAHFDFTAAQCVALTKGDGAACETSCVTGACAAGTCVGRPKGCDDSNACTVDACTEGAGCSHLPRTCPAPTAPCQVARCDSATGCGTEPAPDGTLCGPDLCAATHVDVCMTGACVTRVRLDTGSCANRWVPTGIGARANHAMAYDAARQRVVLFGGSGLPDTWEWDGSTWSQRSPVTSPSARYGYAMAYDAARQRVVLFGGHRLSDTWEWDGSTWSQRSPVTSPSARYGYAMAYDAARQRVVLFGGYDSSTNGQLSLSDTWEWDGSTWSQRSPVTSPSARGHQTMAYDAARQRIVLFGGSDTWEWDGSTWSQRSPVTSPSARGHQTMAYDAARQRIVLFGGYFDDGTLYGSYLSDTWEWDGSTWSQRSPGTLPSARFEHAMAYDAARQRVVLFGGYDNGIYLSDTWEWDGSAWSQRSPATSPSVGSGHAMAYDAARQRVVLLGEDYGNSSNFSITWEWDGSTWSQRSPATSPPARFGHAIAYDAARQRIVLFGGVRMGGNLTDTWEWDGSTWSQRSPVTSPSPRYNHAMAYDAARQRVVLFGGFSQYSGHHNLSDTWEWDGSTWSQRSPVTSPSARGEHAMAYDAARQRIVLFGGVFDDGTVSGSSLSETWEWDGSAWSQRSPATSPSARSGHAMAYDAARQRIVIFGGRGPADTWEWDGSTWSQRMPVTSPPPGGGAMAYDEARQRLTLFNGLATWVFLP
jgi:hypothetical protein